MRPIEAFRRDGHCSPEHFEVLDAEISALETDARLLAERVEKLRTENSHLEARVERAEAEVEGLKALVQSWEDWSRYPDDYAMPMNESKGGRRESGNPGIVPVRWWVWVTEWVPCLHRPTNPTACNPDAVHRLSAGPPEGAP